MQKFKVIEIVNRRWTHPRNVISALTQSLNQQPGFNFGGPLGVTDDDLDPSGETDANTERAVPSEPQLVDEEWTPDDVEPGWVLEEELAPAGTSYFTSFPFEFFRYVWYDGLLATYNHHFTLSGSFELIPNETLLSGTEVIGQYVVGYE